MLNYVKSSMCRKVGNVLVLMVSFHRHRYHYPNRNHCQIPFDASPLPDTFEEEPHVLDRPAIAALQFQVIFCSMPR